MHHNSAASVSVDRGFELDSNGSLAEPGDRLDRCTFLYQDSIEDVVTENQTNVGLKFHLVLFLNGRQNA